MDSPGLAETWPETGPPELWSRPLGAGHTSILVADGRLFTMYRESGAGGGEPWTPSESVIAMDAATMQGVIKRLDGRGLIARRADPDDRRRLVLSLNASGRRLLERALEAGHAITRRPLAPLSAAERNSFLSLLARLAE